VIVGLEQVVGSEARLEPPCEREKPLPLGRDHFFEQLLDAVLSVHGSS